MQADDPDLSDPTALGELVDELVRLHGDGGVAPTRDQWRELLGHAPDGPIQVVYLVAFHEQATYDAPDEPPRSGFAAFMLAGRMILPAIADVGGEPVLGAMLRHTLVDDGDDDWDYVGSARYPSRAAFARLWLDPRFVDAGPHRAAGTRRHRLLVTEPIGRPT